MIARVRAARREWPSVGARYREQVSIAIPGLDWQEVPPNGDPLKMPMFQGMAINAAIKGFQIPRVSHIAIGTAGGLCLYGVRAQYKNGQAEIYILDRGHEAVPVVVDGLPG